MARKDITDKQVCEAYQHFWKEGTSKQVRPLAYLMQTTGQPEKVCWRAMERALTRDLIDFGVNLNVGWLTGKGKQCLRNAM